jgi:hypothetical protein
MNDGGLFTHYPDVVGLCDHFSYHWLGNILTPALQETVMMNVTAGVLNHRTSNRRVGG